MNTRPNQLSRSMTKLGRLPTWFISFVLGRLVPLVGTARLRFDEVSAQRVVVSIRNRRRVQNHIKGVHAAGMALLAETATGFALGMHLPDDKLPLIKTMKVVYLKRAQGHLRAVAQLNAEQVQQVLAQDKGEVTVPVTVTDATGAEPIQCEMVWAWVPRQRS